MYRELVGGGVMRTSETRASEGPWSPHSTISQSSPKTRTAPSLTAAVCNQPSPALAPVLDDGMAEYIAVNRELCRVVSTSACTPHWTRQQVKRRKP
jgi:hypothetical protein